MAIAPSENQIAGLLRYYSRRVRTDLRGRYVGTGAAVAGAGWCLAALASYLNIALRPGTWVVCLGLTVALPLIGFALAALRTPTMKQAAAMLDSRLDNRQRLLTAVELMDSQSLPPVSQAQLSTTAYMLASADPDRVYPVRSPAGYYALGTGLFAVALGLFFLKLVGNGFAPISPGNLALGTPTALAMTSPTPQSGLPNSDAKNNSQPNQVQAGSTPLAIDPQDAARQAAASQKAQDGLDRLKSALDEQSATQGAADSLRQGNYGDAANKLGDLGTQNDQLSDNAKQGIADALNRAANDSGATPNLQQAEQQAANALNQGDYKGISDAMKNLGDAVKDTGQAVVPQQQLAKGFPQQQDPSQNGQSQQGDTGQGQNGQNGQGQGQTQDQNSQQGNGNGNGQQGQGQGGQSQQSGQGQGQGQGQNGGSDTSPSQAQGQSGGSGKGQSKVSGPNDYTPRNVQGDPFQLQGSGDPNQASPDGSADPNGQPQPGLSLQGGGDGAGPAAPPDSGGPVNAPGESNQVPIERWSIIQKYFSHGQ